jgi:hypothetical protein
MNYKERLKIIDDFFENISDEEFKRIAIECGLGRIKSWCDCGAKILNDNGGCKYMKTLEMIKILIENPEMRAKSLHYGIEVKNYEGSICYCVDNSCLKLNNDFINSEWKIIEPEKVNFITAFKKFKNSGTNRIVSCLTNNEFHYVEDLLEITDEELDDKWIVLDE